MKRANITDIQHFNVHDGPGIRTVVFFQGCSLKCKWCQNPETISRKARIMYNPQLCIGCGACIKSCPNDAIFIEENQVRTDPSKCTACGICTEECYTIARKLTSKEMTVDEVYDEVIKDAVVYRRSGGGVTISGGEPLLHIEFNTNLFQKLKEEGIRTAVETAGNIPTDSLDQIAPYTDTFLFDFKLFDTEKHKIWIGADNTQILKNIRHICNIHDNVVIRIPLIPSVNDTEEEFGRMMEFVTQLRKINSVHILPFHHFGASKYTMLGEEYELVDFEEENQERIRACLQIAEAHGIKVNLGGTGFAEDKKLR